jgi:hypothetical protein
MNRTPAKMRESEYMRPIPSHAEFKRDLSRDSSKGLASTMRWAADRRDGWAAKRRVADWCARFWAAYVVAAAEVLAERQAEAAVLAATAADLAGVRAAGEAERPGE